jgi:hypothetical protein
LQAIEIAGSGFDKIGRRLASLVARSSAAQISRCNAQAVASLSAEWKLVDAELHNLQEKHGWKLYAAAQRLRNGDRECSALTAGVDPKNATLVEWVRRLVLQLEGTPIIEDSAMPLVQPLEVVSSETAADHKEMAEFLDETRLGMFTSKFVDFGCASVADLCDADIVSDGNLAKDIGMNPVQVRW